MSILYCSIPNFVAALARRENPSLQHRPLVFLGPDDRVLAVSTEATACGVAVGLTARAAEIRCPEARLLEADVARYRVELEAMLELLERTSPNVEPHGWGAAYVDLGDLARQRAEAVAICREVGQTVQRELGKALQPALGWNSTKFTAQTATYCTRPGHLLAIATVRERAFLQPLSVVLLPLGEDALRRLGFLGLRTLGQYAMLPPGAVYQHFGRAGKLAQYCARGEDNRPVIPRSREQRLTAQFELEAPLAEQERLLAVLQRLVSPLLTKLRESLQACGRMRLSVHFVDGAIQEKEHTFLFPTADEGRVLLTLEQLLHQMQWHAGATALGVILERIQDAVRDQLSLIPAKTKQEDKLREVQRCLMARFGADRLRRAILSQPNAPLPEWRVGWLTEEEP